MTSILVDQMIAIRGEDYPSRGIRIDRYDADRRSDRGLLEYAASEKYRVLVLVGDGHLLDQALVSAAQELGITLVVVRQANPILAADLVRQYADELVSPAGPVLRLLSSGPEVAL